ncbi:hypothetical protein [Anabaena sp. CCY 9402-a]|uniref:hypothetical protein n=1 Tax=Anabaena sp. CCY 9402-a TaxID=3103867 RepID=UPI0039C5EF11
MDDSASDAVPRPREHHYTYSAQLAYNLTYALLEQLTLSDPKIGKYQIYLQHLFTLIDQEIGLSDSIGGDRCQNLLHLTKLQICI